MPVCALVAVHLIVRSIPGRWADGNFSKPAIGSRACSFSSRLSICLSTFDAEREAASCGGGLSVSFKV